MEKCEKCEAEFETAAQLRGHMMTHAKKEQAAEIAVVRARTDMENETVHQKADRIRRSRKPFGAPEKKWSCPMDDGYFYRVFNDNWSTRPGNIQRALDAGYEFVHSEKDREKPQVVGTNDNGTPITGHLMRIPQEVFEEDQREKQKVVDRVDDQIRKGSLQSGTNDGRYVPSGGIKITDNHRPPDV